MSSQCCSIWGQVQLCNSPLSFFSVFFCCCSLFLNFLLLSVKMWTLALKNMQAGGETQVGDTKWQHYNLYSRGKISYLKTDQQHQLQKYNFFKHKKTQKSSPNSPQFFSCLIDTVLIKFKFPSDTSCKVHNKISEAKVNGHTKYRKDAKHMKSHLNTLKHKEKQSDNYVSQMVAFRGFSKTKL